MLVFVSILAAGRAESAERERTMASDPGVEQRIELFLALLRRRAERALETHPQVPAPTPAPRRPLISGSADIAQGYESNVFLDGDKRGDFFTEESVALSVTPEFTPQLTGDLSYELSNTHYGELRDANSWSNTLTAAAKWQPSPRAQGGIRYEFAILNFPFDTSSSFLDHRLILDTQLALTRRLSWKTGLAYQSREYDTRKARDGGGNDLDESTRVDQRHTVTQTLSLRLPRTSLKLVGQAYRNTSNDAFEDFYDWDDLQVRGVASRVVGRSWVSTLVVGHERRNYQARSVPAIAIAERDNLETLAGSLSYLITPAAQVTYSLTYRFQDSNDPRLDFTDWVNQMRCSITF